MNVISRNDSIARTQIEHPSPEERIELVPERLERTLRGAWEATYETDDLQLRITIKGVLPDNVDEKIVGEVVNLQRRRMMHDLLGAP